MEGCVNLGYPAMHRPGVELAIFRSLVRRHNHYTTEPPVVQHDHQLWKHATIHLSVTVHFVPGLSDLMTLTLICESYGHLAHSGTNITSKCEHFCTNINLLAQNCVPNTNFLQLHFYRAMHFSAFARSWDRMSSVCTSVTLVICDHIGWNVLETNWKDN